MVGNAIIHRGLRISLPGGMHRRFGNIERDRLVPLGGDKLRAGTEPGTDHDCPQSAASTDIGHDQRIR